MSLIKCEECYEEISSYADKCPHCGKKQGYKLSRTAAVIIGFVILLPFVFYKPSPTQPKEPPDPVKEARFQKTLMVVATIKKNMRDPDSIAWEIIRANDDASVICAEYRARNGFGGMSKEFFIYTKNKTSQKPEAWNKHCTKPMFDMIYVEHALK